MAYHITLPDHLKIEIGHHIVTMAHHTSLIYHNTAVLNHHWVIMASMLEHQLAIIGC